MAAVYADVLLFVVALLVLIEASDLFTSATARIGLSFGISPFIIGATVVAGGTSLPELVSSALAVVRGAPTIVIGNVVGSNVANIFVVLGIAAVVTDRIWIERELMRVDLPILVASAVFLVVSVWDGRFVWYEGVLALALLTVYVHSMYSRPARLDETVEDLVEDLADDEVDIAPAALEETATETRAGPQTYAILVVSLVFMILAADGVVQSILGLAAAFGVGPEIVAMTAVGVGTSLPEVAVSVAAVRQGDPEIAVGSVLGSNVFNSLAVVGVPGLFVSLPIPQSVRTFALPVMVLATLLYYFITQDREITRYEGAVLLILYAAFLVNLLLVA